MGFAGIPGIAVLPTCWTFENVRSNGLDDVCFLELEFFGPCFVGVSQTNLTSRQPQDHRRSQETHWAPKPYQCTERA